MTYSSHGKQLDEDSSSLHHPVLYLTAWLLPRVMNVRIELRLEEKYCFGDRLRGEVHVGMPPV